jgi:hypothetical protein
MSVHLQPPIDLYTRIENLSDFEALSDCFASNATVRDEGHTHQGLAAIREWMADTKKKFNHTIAPLEVSHRDGRTVLKAKPTGNFPGSRVTLEFSFALADGKIVSLEIHS